VNPFSLSGKKILVLAHKGADVDAISSAGILYLILRKKNFVEIAIPEHLNKSAEKLAESMEIPYTMKPDFNDFNTLFIIDMNSYNMLGAFSDSVKEFKGKKFLFDHHSNLGEAIESDYSFCDETAASSTEVLWMELKNHKFKPSEKIALLTVTGLLTDSGNFHFAGRNSFGVMAEAMELIKMQLYEIRELFSVELSLSERIAKLKAAKKSSIYRMGKTLVVTSHVGAFESQAAGSFIRLGADVAFVAMQEKNSVRVSGRASQRFVDAMEIDLAKDVLHRLAEFFEGEGGGHVTAAAFTGKTKSKELMLEKCRELLLEKLKEKQPRGLDFKEYK